MPGSIRRADKAAAAYRIPLLLALVLATLGSSACAQTAPTIAPPFDTSTCSRPVYPVEDAQQKHGGTVTMQFLIGPDGKVERAKIQQSSGYRSLDTAARDALVKCRFRPAMVDGKPTRAWTAIQYVWTPE